MSTALNVENQNDFLRLTKVWLIVVDAIFSSSKDVLHFFATKNIEQIMLCSYCEKKPDGSLCGALSEAKAWRNSKCIDWV